MQHTNPNNTALNNE